MLDEAFQNIYRKVKPSTKPVEKLSFSPQALDELRDAGDKMPGMAWSLNTRLTPDMWTYAEGFYANPSRYPALHADINGMKEMYDRNGFTIANLSRFTEEQGHEATKKALLLLLTKIGEPVGVFKRTGFWQTLGVKKEMTSLRGESLGYIPFHSDFDQASQPPKAVTLYSLRADPLGGGETLIFNYQDFFKEEGAQRVNELKNVNFSYSVLFDTDGLGEIYNPHPLLETREDGSLYFRYNGKAFNELPNAEMQNLFLGLEREFLRRSQLVLLDTGDLIVANQKKTLHARTPLNRPVNGERPAATSDRLLYQTHLVDNDIGLG